MLLASIIIQSATNMFNEYYDFVRGLDTEESVGIGGAIVKHGVRPKTILRLAILFIVISVLLGVYICAQSSWWVAAAGIVSISMGYLYAGGPYPISSTPFGELFAGFFMGVVIIVITFFIQTGTVTAESILISVPITILCSAILTANNIRDINEDKGNGRCTLAIMLGHDRAVIFLAVMFVMSYLWILGIVVLGFTSPWLLIAFASLPRALKTPGLFKNKKTPVEMIPGMKATAQLHTYSGFLVTTGLLLAYLI